ncbi:hypothetical protein AAU57_09580 [Nonlabens sp. YIK11]|uniref:hypothetical protein n=1 Tax=Nonlabens sp. YIK11 TaxID=1453349 RepID=UPI0006DCDE08|nr:hypothetical protein [Nonlabens sp. YIK11]KQC33537.1 hypothetical protein AAU57_09580 [Nonlabens sp. YIK11]
MKNFICISILCLSLFQSCFAQSANADSKLIRRSKKAYSQLDWKKAERLFKKARERENLEDDVSSQIYYANILFAKKDYEKSRNLYHSILSNLAANDDKRSFLQQGISRSQKNIEYQRKLKEPRLDIEKELKSGIIKLDSYDKITSLDQMVVYPGCESSADQKATDRCLHYYLNDLISYNFRKNILTDLGLPTSLVMYLDFKVMTDGVLKDIEVYSVHPTVELEAIRILKGAPKLEPAVISGKPIAVLENFHVHLY